MQKAYTMTDHTPQDQKDYIKDVFYLYLDVLASDIGHKWDLHNTPRQKIEDDVLAIELKDTQETLGVIDGGKKGNVLPVPNIHRRQGYDTNTT